MDEKLKNRFHFDVIALGEEVPGIESEMESMNFFFESCAARGILVRQNTGISDRNKKFIFEHDLVRFGGLVGYVVYHSGQFLLKFGGNDALYSFLKDADQCEVVGNVYQNRELLSNYDDIPDLEANPKSG